MRIYIVVIGNSLEHVPPRLNRGDSLGMVDERV
jgi:hypothetical protein